jgi:arabinose-5-phosphate isomerase
MSTDVAATAGEWSQFEQLRYAREIIQMESRALAQVAKQLGREFCRAADYLYHCRGNVIVSGMGKAGIVGQKIMATLASTGTPSHYMHPAEAVHGDLGRVRGDDLMLILSQSGETEEVVRILPTLRGFGVPIVAITAQADSTLGRAAAAVIELGKLEEAGNLALAPSTSTTAMLAVGDALALVVSRMRRFAREDFARFHPAGALGLKLSKVDEHLRPLEECRLASDRQTVREVLIGARVPGRRTGATMLIDDAGRLSGIFTDSDLARLFEDHRDGDLDAAIGRVMTANPKRIQSGSLLSDAIELMAGKKISELPVVDADGKPVGLIDITDLLGMFPRELAFNQPATSTAAARIKPPYRVYSEADKEIDTKAGA